MQPYASLINLADVQLQNALNNQDQQCPQWNAAAILERHREETKGSQGPELTYTIERHGKHEFHVSFTYQKTTVEFDGEHYYPEHNEVTKTFTGKEWR